MAAIRHDQRMEDSYYAWPGMYGYGYFGPGFGWWPYGGFGGYMGWGFGPTVIIRGGGGYHGGYQGGFNGGYRGGGSRGGRR